MMKKERDMGAMNKGPLILLLGIGLFLLGIVSLWWADKVYSPSFFSPLGVIFFHLPLVFSQSLIFISVLWSSCDNKSRSVFLLILSQAVILLWSCLVFYGLCNRLL